MTNVLHTFMLVFPVASMLGTGLVIYFLLARPVFFRRLLSVVWGLSYAIEDGLSSFHRHSKGAGREIGRRSVSSPQATLDPVRRDVLDALTQLGMGRKLAENAVMSAPGSDFDSIFKFATRTN